MSTWFRCHGRAESRDVYFGYFGLDAALEISRAFTQCAWNCTPIASLPKE